MYSPGDPLNPAGVAGVQEALPMDIFIIPSHIMQVGGGSYAMNIPVLLPVPIQHAQYKSSDVPFQPVRTNYKP